MIAGKGEARGPLLAVTLQVMFDRMFRMLGGVKMMGVRQLRVMSGLLVVAGLVVLRCFGVVMRGHAVMVGGLAVFVHCVL
jgi:hypothetical protein